MTVLSNTDSVADASTGFDKPSFEISTADLQRIVDSFTEIFHPYCNAGDWENDGVHYLLSKLIENLDWYIGCQTEFLRKDSEKIEKIMLDGTEIQGNQLTTLHQRAANKIQWITDLTHLKVAWRDSIENATGSRVILKGERNDTSRASAASAQQVRKEAAAARKEIKAFLEGRTASPQNVVSIETA